MALKSDLQLLLYPAPGLGIGQAVNYANALDDLSFSSTIPGGCGDLSAKARVSDVHKFRAELELCSRIAVTGNGGTWWTGEVSDPEIGFDESGDYVQITGLGLGNGLRDDPRSVTYSAKTPQQMVTSEISAGNRPNYLTIDQDTSQIFPDNPGATYSPAYVGKNLEEIIADVCKLAGDYVFGTWPFAIGNQPAPAHEDIFSLPAGQLAVVARDTSTVSYTALLELGDVRSWRIISSLERAFNVIQVAYNDPGQAVPVGIATATDSRLAANGSQGSAAFRRRVNYQDLSGVSTVNAAQAAAIASAYLALFQNPTNKVEIVLTAARDKVGGPMPLYQLLAGRNIYVPKLSLRRPTMSFGPQAGVNLFYIVEARYQEQGEDVTVTLQCDNFVDTVAQQVARLQLEADVELRLGQRTTGAVQALGAPLKAHGGFLARAAAGANNFGAGVNYGVALTQLPTSISLTASVSTNINGGASTAGSDYYGCTVWGGSTAAGAMEWEGTVTTVGN
jgi:hypothetical protein